jgi:hypothetical protein
MNHYKPLAVLLVCCAATWAVARQAEKKGETVEGTLLKVDTTAHKITVMPMETKENKEKGLLSQREFAVAEATKFVFGTGAGKAELARREAYKDQRLKEGSPVTVLTDEKGVAKEVRVGMSPKSKEPR